MTAKKSVLLNGMEVRFCLNENETNGVLTMFECIIHAGAKMPVPHYHKDFDETIYGVQGIVSYMVDGKPVEIGPGDSCFIPRGTVHGFSNNTTETIKFLAVINPGIFGITYFQEIAEVFSAGGPPNIAALKDVMQRHGLVPVMG